MPKGRNFRAVQIIQALPRRFGGPQYKTYANRGKPVRRGSIKDMFFVPMPSTERTKRYWRLHAWNRRKAPRRYGGLLGSAAMRVAEVMYFDFFRCGTGRLDPGYEAIAQKTGLGRSTVAKALARLKEFGVLYWENRCKDGRDEFGNYVLEQETNGYILMPPSLWEGYSEQTPPTPEPSEWGACPPLPDLVTQASNARHEGASLKELVSILETDPGDENAAALADLGRAMLA